MTALLFEHVSRLRTHLDGLRARSQSIGVVPTMGALHEGHLSLVRAAKDRCGVVVVTIFVNPTQFGPNEDFAKYPRNLERDLDLLARQDTDVVFAPAVSEMYPPSEQTRVRVTQVSEGLCGAHRPGHFEGVATIVAKLFNAVGPGVYFFGRKDYQQWRLVERMASDLLFPVVVVGCPIVREHDGLAMSSRNVYLSAEERAAAPRLGAALSAARALYRAGECDPALLLARARSIIQPEGSVGPELRIEYLELREAATLAPVTVDGAGRLTSGRSDLVLLVAAHLGTTRLIDNLEL